MTFNTTDLNFSIKTNCGHTYQVSILLYVDTVTIKSITDSLGRLVIPDDTILELINTKVTQLRILLER